MGSDKTKNIIQRLLLFVCLANTSAQWAYEDEGCRTPDRGTGTCILATDCKPMVDFLTQNQPLNNEALGVLRKYQCGFEGNRVKVCCPNRPITLGRPRPTPTSRPTPRPTPGTNLGGDPAPPDVSSHRNMNLLPSRCGISSIIDRITNGNKTELYEFPWMVLISYQTNKGPEFKCGGTLINNRYVLTAAHCIQTSLKMLSVRLGEWDTRTDPDCVSHEELGGDVDCAPPPQNINIEEAIAHPSWNNPPYGNDIGLIRLATAADTSVDTVKPVCLPTTPSMRNYNFNNGKKITVTGWGATETGRPSNLLLKIDIPVMPQPQCVKIFEKQAGITFRQVCAGGINGSDSCSGDSGGPVQVFDSTSRDLRFYQLGIVSFGPRFCGSNPGVYTKVAYYMDWVLDTMKP